MIKDDIMAIQNEAIQEATTHIRTQKDRYKALRVVAVCLTILLAIVLICGTALAWHAITEQQYALNMQYARISDLLDGAVITETGDNSI